MFVTDPRPKSITLRLSSPKNWLSLPSETPEGLVADTSPLVAPDGSSPAWMDSISD